MSHSVYKYSTPSCSAEKSFIFGVEKGKYFNDKQRVVGREVSCEYGRVDLLLTDWVVELKESNQWKQGIGQLIVYGMCWPKKRLWLHIYQLGLMRKPWKYIKKIESVCRELLIRVSFGDEIEEYRELYG